MSLTELRIDKWLWAVRFYKTRALAMKACQTGRIKIDDRIAKPSSAIRPSQMVEIRQPDITRKVNVKELTAKRVGPKLVDEYVEDLTPLSEYERQKQYWQRSPARRERGSGRPTKKDRRETDRFFGI